MVAGAVTKFAPRRRWPRRLPDNCRLVTPITTIRSIDMSISLRLGTLVVCTAGLFAASCSNDDPSKLVASAKSYLARDDANAAIVELKSLLQRERDHAEARYLLGKALALKGDLKAAEVELQRALEHQFDESLVAPELARVLLGLNQSQAVVDRFGQTHVGAPAARADLRTTVAQAYAMLGRLDRANEALADAKAADSNHLPALILEQRLVAAKGDVDSALAGARSLAERFPDSADAHRLHGDLLALRPDQADAALGAYERAIEHKRDDAAAYSSAMNILLARRDLERAKPMLAKLKDVLPGSGVTLILEASIALLDGNVARANELSQQLLRALPDHPRVLQLAAVVAYQQLQFVQAEKHLVKVLNRAPNQDASRRLLGQVYLRLGQADRALVTLQPILDRPQPDPPALRLAAQATMLLGNLGQAQALLQRAAKADPSDTRSRVALAFSKLSGGGAETGIAELRELAASPDDPSADLALISALASRQKYAEALKAVDALEKKLTEKELAAVLRGRIHIASGDTDKAGAAFLSGLQINAKYFPATIGLVQLAMAKKDTGAAREWLDKALQADPSNVQALIAGAQLRAAAGASASEITSLFEDSIRKDPADPAPRLALINHQLANKEFKRALEAAQQAIAALPDRVELVDALGRAQAAAGDFNQAAATFQKLAQLQPGSALPYMRLADTQWASNNRDAAMQSLSRALAAAPQDLRVQRAIFDAHLAANKPDLAAEMARVIQKQRPNDQTGYLLEGGVEASRRRWPQALAIYRAGLDAAADSTELATRLHASLVAAKKEAEATAFARQWIERHPKDGGFLFFLGDFELARKNFADAEARYRQVLAVQPDSALALNNVAWLMLSAGKKGALQYAQKADSLLPNRPAIMDTLAQALAAEGQAAKGVDVMRKAQALEPGNPQLRLSLAKLLIRAGDKPAARSELETLAQLGDKYPNQKEVADLLKTL